MSPLIQQQFIKFALEFIYTISMQEGDFDRAKGEEYWKKHGMEIINLACEEIREEGRRADIFGQLEGGTIAPLVKRTAEVVFKAAAAKFARDMYEYSKIRD